MKKYILKPGNHQFAPASAPIHNNENLTDSEAAWYIEKYPHIKSLFTIVSNNDIVEEPAKKKRNRIKDSTYTVVTSQSQE